VIDFQNANYVKLSPVGVEAVADTVQPLLIEGEQMHAAFKGVRDFIVFTNKRIIAVDAQGMSGKKKDVTSLPYAKVQAFSIESAGGFDRDAELELYFSAAGKVHFEIKGSADIIALNRLIATHVL
jgi:hypothetical protein